MQRVAASAASNRRSLRCFDMGSHKDMYSTQVFKYATIEDQGRRRIGLRYSNTSRKIANKSTFQYFILNKPEYI
ncbi:hypothetical protein AWU65_14735 [Paenibacillus glucanolyticus]|uniref:Uncharacterized protein n=1 Tax=Paenibacillus glucanolyticus TaxID=59843 RepID=A0A162EKT9_9BACL|nr:hypothetical protein AWU65_14735 [Paenibacillus glucanolyticus]